MKPLKMGTAFGVLAIVVSACGVPEDSAPRNIPRADVQYDLLATSTTTSPNSGPQATVIATVFLLGPDNRLIGVERRVAEPLSVGNSLGSLIQGATPAEQANGLRSAINQQTAVLGAEVSEGIAMVDVSDAFSGVGAQEQVLALAQLVYTATAIPGVNSVQVLLNSVAVDVPRGDGTLISSPLTRADYATLAAAP